MKITLTFFGFIFFSLMQAQAQQTKPQLLKEPANWPFERFALPPSFAPNFPYKGAEELRFSPGMFNKDSSGYFTYAFVAELDGVTSISQEDIRNYLLLYFKGLCNSTANDRKLVIDTSKIKVDISKKSSQRNGIVYNALLNVFGVFTDGALVTLNMEIKALKDIKGKKIYLLFIASPLDKTDSIWKQLYRIQNDFAVPIQ